jgi:hypothetical protein
MNLEPTKEYDKIVKAVGGTNINIAPDSGTLINPFDIEEEIEPSKEILKEFNPFFEENTYVYGLFHQQYPQSISYLKGNIQPSLFPLLVAYIQLQMKEVQEEVPLYPHDIQRILENVYGFTEVSDSVECETFELTETMKQNELEDGILLILPFYRRGLYKELQLIVKSILEHFNRQ